MMKKRFTWLLVLTSISLCSYGQLHEFDLAKFKLPDIERQTLEADFDLNGSNQIRKYDNILWFDTEERRNNFSGNVDIAYRHYKNTAVLQRNNQIRFNLYSGYFSSGNGDIHDVKDTRFTPGIFWLRTNRKYFQPSTFFEINQKVRMNAIYRNIDRNDGNGALEEGELTEFTMVGQLPLKYGKGRIEPVQDARHAIYLLDELAKINRLHKAQSDEEVMAFGQFIAKIKNKRFFDSRIKRMAEIEAVDSFLTANDYPLEKDARFFTTLGDYWDFGAGPMRQAGQRFSFVMQPGYYLYGYNGDSQYIGDGKINFTAFMLDAGVEFAYERPINLYWQNSVSAYITGGYVLGKREDQAEDYNQAEDYSQDIHIPNLHAGVEQRVGYYPNTRTYASLGIGAEHIQMDVDIDEDYEHTGGKKKSTNIMANLDVEYYFSPRFRLSASANFSYLLQDSRELNFFHFNDGVGTTSYLDSFNALINYEDHYDYDNKKVFTSFSVKLLYKIF
jgi:hypothetical protein